MLSLASISVLSQKRCRSLLVSEPSPVDLQVDSFLDFDQGNGKSIVFVTDRAYQPGEQVCVIDLQILLYLLLNCYRLLFMKLLFQNQARVGNRFNSWVRKGTGLHSQKGANISQQDN